MTKKIFAPLAAVAAVALMAVSLIASGGTASAAINGISTSASTVNSAATVTLTIDSTNGTGDVTLVTTSGAFTACTDAAPDAVAGTADACAVEALSSAFGATTVTTIVDDDAADNAGGNIDTLVVTWTAPTTTTPSTAQITIVQGSSTKSTTINVRGNADAVSLSILNGASTSTTACEGVAANVIRSTSATAGLQNGTLCTVVTDSSGNKLPSQTVVYTSTEGTITGTTDTTGTSGQRATTSTLAASSTAVSGDEATVTASAGGKSGTDTVKFGGDPATCTVTTDPTSVSVGGSAKVNVAVLDSAGGPVPDDSAGSDSSVNVSQVNSGQGTNAAILNANPSIVNGTASTTAIAAIQGAIALGAASNVAGNTTSCTGSLIATGTVVPPTGTGDGSLTAPTFGTGNVGSAVYAGGTIEQLATQVTAAGGTAVWVQGTDGNWYRYNTLATGATAFVNNAFNTQFSAGLSQSAVFVVK